MNCITIFYNKIKYNVYFKISIKSSFTYERHLKKLNILNNFIQILKAKIFKSVADSILFFMMKLIAS